MKSPKRLWLSFDEWNVWYRARGGDCADGQRTFAPKLLEEVYNLEDALLVGGFLNTLLRQADRVRLACLAQIMNVIAPLVTNETSVLRQSIYYPYAWALQYAHGRVLDLQVGMRDVPDRGGGTARRISRATIRCRSSTSPRRSTRQNGQACVLMLNRDLAVRARTGARLAGPDADARAGLRDPDGTGPEGVQHVRAAEDRSRRGRSSRRAPEPG